MNQTGMGTSNELIGTQSNVRLWNNIAVNKYFAKIK